MTNKFKIIFALLILSFPLFAQNYHVCFGSFSNKLYAQDLVKQLEDGGIESFIYDYSAPDSKILFRVLSKKYFVSSIDSKSYQEQLKQTEVVQKLNLSGLWTLKLESKTEHEDPLVISPVSTSAINTEEKISTQTESPTTTETTPPAIQAPKLKSYGHAKILLEWSGLPYDLDAHLFYGKEHIYYSNKKTQDIKLEIDDTYRYGPEVISIENLYDDELYSFYVHNYSERNSEQTKQLSNSNAKVTLFINDQKIQTFTLDKETPGTLWHVFDIKNGTDIILKNKLSNDKL